MEKDIEEIALTENNNSITQTKTKIEYVSTDKFLKETAISMKKNKKAFKELAK